MRTGLCRSMYCWLPLANRTAPCSGGTSGALGKRGTVASPQPRRDWRDIFRPHLACHMYLCSCDFAPPRPSPAGGGAAAPWRASVGGGPLAPAPHPAATHSIPEHRDNATQYPGLLPYARTSIYCAAPLHAVAPASSLAAPPQTQRSHQRINLCTEATRPRSPASATRGRGRGHSGIRRSVTPPP